MDQLHQKVKWLIYHVFPKIYFKKSIFNFPHPFNLINAHQLLNRLQGGRYRRTWQK